MLIAREAHRFFNKAAMRFVPYPAIEKHGIVSDRQSAAVIAADGTLSWLCVPRYDGKSVFGALLDADHGGFWRLGPEIAQLGTQRYADDSCVLVTRWSSEESELELADAMVHRIASPARAREAVALHTTFSFRPDRRYRSRLIRIRRSGQR